VRALVIPSSRVREECRAIYDLGGSGLLGRFAGVKGSRPSQSWGLSIFIEFCTGARGITKCFYRFCIFCYEQNEAVELMQ
jgi:hypothetical protein